MSAEHDATELENRLERITAAIRIIHKHHNLADRTYDVRDFAARFMRDGDGTSWEHPFVLEYGAAVKTLVDEGVIGHKQELDLTKPQTFALQGGPRHNELITLEAGKTSLEIVTPVKLISKPGEEGTSIGHTVAGNYVLGSDVRILNWRAAQ